jgi:ribose transport system permease protein
VTNLKDNNVKNNRFKISDYVVYISFFGIFILFSIILYDGGFLTGQNLLITRQTAMISLMAIGTTFVLSAGEIDLSIGSIIALSALITAILLRLNYYIWISVLAGLSTGAFIGFVNGIIVTKLRVPSFLITLGMMTIVAGLARWITNLEAVPVTNKIFNYIFGNGKVLGIPILLLWTVGFLILGQTFLKKTSFGRSVLSTGGNKVASLFTGINVDRIKLAVFIISGVSASFAGVLYTGRLEGARYTLGQADLLLVIAAVIIGGTRLSGGKGTCVGSVVGSLIMGMIANGLVLMNLNIAFQMVFRGLIIIIAVSFSLRERKRL